MPPERKTFASQRFLAALRLKNPEENRGDERDRTVGLLSAIPLKHKQNPQLTNPIVFRRRGTSAVPSTCEENESRRKRKSEVSERLKRRPGLVTCVTG
jgi:hypothetical protein